MSGNSAAVKTIGVSNGGGFFCISRNQPIDNEMVTYSRFKFGDITAIELLSSTTARFFIEQLIAGGSLIDLFDKAKKRGEYVYLQSPGIRNVASSSNYLMASVASKVNVWLANNGYPTMIKKPIIRLASGIPNYAELSAETRNRRVKTTVSLLPISDYATYPIHVIFIDDVEVTGCTRERAEYASINGGALSFYSIFAYRVEAALAKGNAAIENMMNQCAVKGGLDDVVVEILAHPDYQPVQRMLRLLLHSRNRNDWPEFARSKIPSKNLLRLYLAALSNDYHAILAEGELIYAPSLDILRGVLNEKGLINGLGLPV